MADSSPHSELGELFVPRDELLDVLERRFLAKDGTPWAEIEELEQQAFALVRGLQEQYEVQRDKLVTLDAEHDRLREQLEAAGDGQTALFAENMRLKNTLERIRDWRNFRHTGEVRDAAAAALSNPASRQGG